MEQKQKPLIVAILSHYQICKVQTPDQQMLHLETSVIPLLANQGVHYFESKALQHYLVDLHKIARRQFQN